MLSVRKYSEKCLYKDSDESAKRLSTIKRKNTDERKDCAQEESSEFKGSDVLYSESIEIFACTENICEIIKIVNVWFVIASILYACIKPRSD